jgi:hypothetical protein
MACVLAEFVMPTALFDLDLLLRVMGSSFLLASDEDMAAEGTDFEGSEERIANLGDCFVATCGGQAVLSLYEQEVDKHYIQWIDSVSRAGLCILTASCPRLNDEIVAHLETKRWDWLSGLALLQHAWILGSSDEGWASKAEQEEVGTEAVEQTDGRREEGFQTSWEGRLVGMVSKYCIDPACLNISELETRLKDEKGALLSEDDLHAAVNMPAVDLLMKMLQVNPALRLTAAEACSALKLL